MKTLKIGAHNVEFKLPFSFPKNDAMAMVDIDQKIIRMEGGFPTSVTLVALLHEIFHLLDDQGEWDLFIGSDPDNPAGEGFIDAFAESLAQVLIDNKMINPQFMAMLKRQSKK